MPKIRFVVAEDFERWLPLWEGYNRFYARSGFLVYRKQL